MSKKRPLAPRSSILAPASWYRIAAAAGSPIIVELLGVPRRFASRVRCAPGADYHAVAACLGRLERPADPRQYADAVRDALAAQGLLDPRSRRRTPDGRASRSGHLWISVSVAEEALIHAAAAAAKMPPRDWIRDAVIAAALEAVPDG
jgi:hypothetical protein